MKWRRIVREKLKGVLIDVEKVNVINKRFKN